MNPKIEKIEEAEAAIETVTAEKEQLHNDALQDGIIDAQEQTDLDRLTTKLDQLRKVVSTLRATLEENRRIWDAKEPALAEWTQQLIALHEAAKPDLTGFDDAETAMNAAVADQRWADASDALDKTIAAMKPIYAAFLAEVPPAGGGTPTSPPPVPSVNADEDQWTSAQAAFTRAMTALERHKQAGHASIAPEIAATKTSATAAQALATAGDFAGAVKAITPLIAACAATEDKAHAAANYDAIQSQRGGLVAVYLGSPVGEPTIDDLQTEIEKLFGDAQADAAAGKYGDAITKLDKIPAISDRARGLRARRDRYIGIDKWARDSIKVLDKATPAQRAPLQKQIDRFKKEHANAQFTKTKDYNVSNPKMEVIWKELGALETAIDACTTYATDLIDFDKQLAVIEKHDGKLAIQEFLEARKLDRQQAVTDAKSTRFPTASALLTRTPAGDWVAKKAIADAYVTYLANQLAAQKLIDEVRALPDTTDLIAQADALMATASTQAIAKDIAAAELSIVDATICASDAKTASEAQAALGALRDDAALDGAGSDFPAALAVYTNMRAHVVAQDSTSTFAAEIAKADIPADAAEAEAASGAPDMAVVRANLDAAIAVLEAVLPQILAFARYKTNEAKAITLVHANLTGLNARAENCISRPIEACKALILEAQNLAKDPSFDFFNAEGKLAQGMEQGRAAETNGKLFVSSIAPQKTAINNALTLVNGKSAGVITLMAKPLTRMKDLSSDTTAALASDDFALAVRKAAEGAAVAATAAQNSTICETIDKDYDAWNTDQMSDLEGGEPEVADALALARRKTVAFNTAIKDGSYRLAEELMGEISLAIQAGQQALKEAAPYKPAQENARAKLDAIVALSNPAIEQRLTALEGRYDAAIILGKEPQYLIATRKMNEIAPEADALLPIAQAFGAYEAARVTADTKLVEAETHAQLDAIQTIVSRLRAKYTTAEQMAQDGDPARAQTMMEEVEAGAIDAIGNADNAAIFAGVTDAIGDSAGSGGPNFMHLAAARKAYDWQADKANASVASTELAEADTKLSLAENDATPPADQTIALQSAMDLVTQAGQIISQHTLLSEALATARVRVAEFRAHPQGSYMSAQLSEMDAGISDVQVSATDLASLPGCSADLETIMVGVHEMRAKLDAQAEYLVLRPDPKVEPHLAILEGHTHSFAIQTEIDTMRSKLADAARLSEDFDPVAAVVLLNEVKAIGLSASLLAEMKSGKIAPDLKDVKEILARPGGDAEFDAMVDALEPDAQRAILKVAFKARFDCDLRSFTTANPPPNIQRFYEIMSELPETDTFDNKSLRAFDDRPNATGASDYTGGDEKRIVMRQGDAVLSPNFSFGAEFEVGEVDEGCEPANDEPVNYFSWNTLHEVGHAVDDQHSFMGSRQSGAAFGGWTEYGSNTDPIAKIAAAHFDLDKTYVQQAMGRKLESVDSAGTRIPADEDAAVPEPPGGCTPEEWERRRIVFTTWLAKVRAPREPWANNATAKEIAIDGVVYQESYTASWTSYQFGARSRGITAYQFRSPAEWFSELYAAYHSGKIKDKHPAASWLSKLANPDAA